MALPPNYTDQAWWVFMGMGSLYCCIVFFTLCLLLRMTLQDKYNQRKRLKLFYALIAISNSARAFFFFDPIIDLGDVMFRILNFLPSLFFFMTFALLLFFWADVDAVSRLSAGPSPVWDSYRKRLKGVLLVMNVVMVVAQCTLFLLFFFLKQQEPENLLLINRVEVGFISACSLLIGLGFLFFGKRLLLQVEQLSDMQSRALRARKIKIVAVSASLSFCLRAAFAPICLYYHQWIYEHEVGGFDAWLLTLIVFYSLSEVLPSVVILVIIGASERSADSNVNTSSDPRAASSTIPLLSKFASPFHSPPYSPSYSPTFSSYSPSHPVAASQFPGHATTEPVRYVYHDSYSR